jgi:glycosyltransferase involved in cell wall biosynthesis
VIHLPYGIPMIPLCQSLRDKGVFATSCHTTRHEFGVQPDICLHLEKYSPQQKLKNIEVYFQKIMNRYDIFHYHFGTTLFEDKSDLRILAKAGKKLIVHHQGSDARILSEAIKSNPYVRVKPYWTEEVIRENLKLLSSYIHHAIVPSYELVPYIKPYYSSISVIPSSITIEQFQPRYYVSNNKPLLVVHAPTNRDIKGTEFILDAVAKLKKRYNFQFILIEKFSHEQAKAIYREADIVIDQLRIGDVGITSIEAMALGKAVICHIRKDLRKRYEGIPIVDATPDTIIASLKYLLSHPGVLYKLGIKGRKYVEKHHLSDLAAEKLIKIYKKL